MAKMSVSVTDQQADWIGEAVKSGDYASSSEVIREALRSWRAKRELGRLWDEGLTSGPMEDLDMGKIKAAAREEFSRR